MRRVFKEQGLGASPPPRDGAPRDAAFGHSLAPPDLFLGMNPVAGNRNRSRFLFFFHVLVMFVGLPGVLSLSVLAAFP